MKDLALIRARHLETGHREEQNDTLAADDGCLHWCSFDRQPWPCDVTQVLDRLTAMTVARDAAVVEADNLRGSSERTDDVSNAHRPKALR